MIGERVGMASCSFLWCRFVYCTTVIDWTLKCGLEMKISGGTQRLCGYRGVKVIVAILEATTSRWAAGRCQWYGRGEITGGGGGPRKDVMKSGEGASYGPVMACRYEVIHDYAMALDWVAFVGFQEPSELHTG